MGQARQVRDRFTEAALINGDLKQLRDCFAEDRMAFLTQLGLLGPR